MNDNKENFHNPSLRDELIGLLKNDEVKTLIQQLLTHSKKVYRTKVISNSIILFLLAFFVGFGVAYLGYQAGANQTLIAFRNVMSKKNPNMQTNIQYMKKTD